MIGIVRDNYGNSEHPDSASEIWEKYLTRNDIKFKIIEIKDSNILDQLNGCSALMWRWAHFGGMRIIATSLLPVIEKELEIPVYPDQNTCWHYDNKIAQSYLFQAHNIPCPETWVFYDPSLATQWLKTAKFPLVLKLKSGAGGSNVVLVEDSEDALVWVKKLFSRYVLELKKNKKPFSLRRLIRRLIGRDSNFSYHGYEPQAGYIYFQEFLDNNEFDTRIVVVGEKAFGFRRFNRKDDFRASGSGLIDWDYKQIDLRFLDLAFDVAKKLSLSSCAIDGMYKDGKPVIGEISYTYASWAVKECAGYWLRCSDGYQWVNESRWVEEIILENFLEKNNLL